MASGVRVIGKKHIARLEQTNLPVGSTNLEQTLKDNNELPPINGVKALFKS